MSQSNKDVHWFREIFQDPNGRLSSGRIMQMMGNICGCIALLAWVFGFGDNVNLVDLGTVLAVLFVSTYSSKTLQSFPELDKSIGPFGRDKKS